MSALAKSPRRTWKVSETWTVKIGDRVRIKAGGFAVSELDGKTGVIVGIQRNGAIGVEFDFPFSGMHDCDGLAPSGRGRWGFPTGIDPIYASTMGYEAGREEAVWALALKLASPTSDVHRILFYGPPGTGKTTAAVKSASDTGYYCITVTPDTQVAEILGHWIPKGDEFVWHDGIGIRAWKQGALLNINEICDASSPVQTILHAILDDKSIAQLTLPNGEVVKPHPQFRCVATMNGQPGDLPDALRDRFDAIYPIDTPSPEAIQALPVDLRQMVVGAYSNPDNISCTYRNIASFGKRREHLGEDDAGKVVFGPTWRDIKTAVALSKKKATSMAGEVLAATEIADEEVTNEA